MDLVCLVADKNMEAAIQGILGRPESLRIRPITCETIVHPRRDPGCFHEAPRLLRGYREHADHAIVLFDLAWHGAPTGSAVELEGALEGSLREAGLSDWARAVVLDPELEVWVFSDSPHVAEALGWNDRAPGLRAALEQRGAWPARATKPPDPKGAVEWALREARRARSSSIYRRLANSVSLKRCSDPAFGRLTHLLRTWFGVRPA